MTAAGRTAVLLALGSALAGCAVATEAERRIKAGDKSAETRLAAVAAAQARGPVAHSGAPFFGRSVITADKAAQLPPDLECAGCFVAISAVPLDLAASADWLARQSGLAVALAEGTEASDRTEAPGAPAAAWRPHFRGRLSAFLDALAARFDIAWSVDDRTLRLDPAVTRMYRLAAGAAATTLSAVTAGSVSGEQGDSGQNAETHTRVDAWTDIDELVRSQLPPGARFALSPSAGTLTLTARPSVHARIDRLVEQINAVLGPRVTARVSLFLIDVSDGDEFGLNIDLLFRDAASGAAFGIEGLAASAVGAAGALAGAVAAPPPDSGLAPWTGSSVVARAVARSGRLLDRHHAVISSRSAAAAPVQLTTRTNYIKELEVTVEDGETSIATEVETLVTGYSLQVLPRVIDGGRLSLYLAVSTTDLIDLNTRSFGDRGAFLSLPTVARRAFTLDNVMADGETLVLAGYDQNRSSLTETGAGVAGFKGLGGTTEAKITRTRLIIVVEPRLRAIPRPRAPAAVLITAGAGTKRP